jgi:hypothetical protein
MCVNFMRREHLPENSFHPISRQEDAVGEEERRSGVGCVGRRHGAETFSSLCIKIMIVTN